MDSQTAQVLKALKTGRSLSPMDALREFQCFRLSARIYDLRAAGYHIETHMRDVGNGRRVALYKLVKASA